jgi:hypothetical protein
MKIEVDLKFRKIGRSLAVILLILLIGLIMGWAYPLASTKTTNPTKGDGPTLDRPYYHSPGDRA